MAHYLMNDDAADTHVDDAEGAHDGVLTGGNTEDKTAAGKINACVDFDGADDYVTIADHADFDFAAGFSLACWAKPDATDADGRLIYRYDPTSADGFMLTQLAAGSGNWSFYVFVSPTFDDAKSDAAPSGNWQHLVGVRAADGTLTLYVDGVAQAATGSKAGAIDSSDPIYLGVDRGLASDFAGLIDDVRIFNRALTQTEIDGLYNLGDGTEGDSKY